MSENNPGRVGVEDESAISADQAANGGTPEYHPDLENDPEALAREQKEAANASADFRNSLVADGNRSE